MNSLLNLLLAFLLFSIIRNEAVKTTKGVDMTTFDGYQYRKKGISADGGTQFWQCIVHTCNGRAHSNINSEHLRIVSQHNHPRDLIGNIVRERKEQLKETSRNNPLLPPRVAYLQSREGLSDEALMAMPSYSAAQRQVEIQREIPGRRLVDARELADIVIDGEFATDYNGQRFLLYDSRVDEPENVVFFIWSTDEGLRRLRTYTHWSSDGTFKVVPSSFLQLYTINVLIEESSVVGAFILMANKAFDTYVRVFEQIRGRLNGVAPQSIIIDFEQSAKNAINHVWPGTQVRTCLFHLGQSILRRVQREGFIGMYEHDEDTRIIIRCLASLSFLPINRVQYGFNLLYQNPAAQIVHPIFDYFRRNYIMRDNNDPPLFPIDLWNQHDAVIADLCRTNNAIESFHRTLRGHFANVHPPLSKVISALKTEERMVQDKLRIYELDFTRGITLRKRTRTYVNNDAALKRMVLQFDQNPNMNDDEFFTHLRAIQFRLAQNGFNHWDD